MIVYRRYMPRFSNEQKISMEKIQTDLNIPSKNFQEIINKGEDFSFLHNKTQEDYPT